MSNDNIYAAPRDIADINECYFYHTMDIPGYGVVHGEWDLRAGFRKYLGEVDFHRRRVLELGTASGFLCFEMEKMGAEVVAQDLSDQLSWDIVPFHDMDYQQMILDRKAHILKLNNGYWLAHKAFKSNAKVVYSSVYELPEQIGEFDVSVLGSILLHVRDPFLALQKALQFTKETVIITDMPPRFHRLTKFLPPRFHRSTQSLKRAPIQIDPFTRLMRPHMEFLPNYKRRSPVESWWFISPELIAEFISILGFEDIEFYWHKQLSRGREVLLYTIVGHRNK